MDYQTYRSLIRATAIHLRSIGIPLIRSRILKTRREEIRHAIMIYPEHPSVALDARYRLQVWALLPDRYYGIGPRRKRAKLIKLTNNQR